MRHVSDVRQPSFPAEGEALYLDHRDSGLFRGSSQLVVEHRELERRMAAEDLERRLGGGKMQAVIAAQAVTPREISGATNQGFGDGQNFPRFPLNLQIPSQGGKERFVSPIESYARKRGTHLHVRDRMRGRQSRLGDYPADPARIRFLDEQFYQRGCIQIEDHPRCSLTISARVFSSLPIRIKGFGNAGFLPLPGRTQGRLRNRAISSASVEAARRRER